MSDRYGISIGRIRHPTDFSHGSEVACTHAFRLNKREQLTSILAVNPVNPRVREFVSCHADGFRRLVCRFRLTSTLSLPFGPIQSFDLAARSIC